MRKLILPLALVATSSFASSVRHFVLFCTSVKDTSMHYGIVGDYIYYNKIALNMDGKQAERIPYTIIKDDCKDSGSVNAKDLIYVVKNFTQIEKPLYNCEVGDYSGPNDIDISYLPNCK